MTDNKTCPLCGAILIPRYEFEYEPLKDGRYTAQNLHVRYICSDCIPPEAN